LLADFTREEILRLLSTRPMTETQLSKKLGLTKAAVGYHLHLLREAGLLYIEKTETEKHGILQKYYSPVAATFIVNPEKIPRDVRTYFIQTQIQYLRGIFSVFRINNRTYCISSKALEKLALALLKQLKEVGEKYINKKITKEDVEAIRVKIYAEALANLTKQEEWKGIIRKPRKRKTKTVQ